MMNREDLYFFNQGELYDAYRIFGAHIVKNDVGEHQGVRFTVWAPHAKKVSVLGEFNDYQSWVHNLAKVDESGIDHELPCGSSVTIKDRLTILYGVF